MYSVKCAAHSLQLAVNYVLKNENIVNIVKQCNKIVEHFKHSSQTSLEEKQEILGLTKTTLLQSYKTRWNSVYLMMGRLADRSRPKYNISIYGSKTRN